MAVIKCKMCGGDLTLEAGSTVCQCEFCGTTQTVPSENDEKKAANLFNRANRLRMSAEFDKAASVYASITAEFPLEAEAYWGLCLCRFGIEYVDDPASGEKKPTCHRTRPESIMDDPDFEQACDLADPVASKLYQQEARAIDRIQRRILSIVEKETPYDVFICYKETDENGSRTEDSVLAQEAYDALTAKGLKVFFARVTLESKLGQEYEPYIYAALSSAKVMLVIGTAYERYDAVWVKNEWSRYLDMMKSDKDKRLIPCYKGIEAYDMPREFKNLQAQDLGKLGWQQDLTRGVLKLLGKDEAKNAAAPAQAVLIEQLAANTSMQQAENLVKRALIFMEDGKYNDAKTYLDKALDANAEYAPAYVGKVMAQLQLTREDQLSFCDVDTDRAGGWFYDLPDWKKAMRFATPEQKNTYEGYVRAAQQSLAEDVGKVIAEAEAFEGAQGQPEDVLSAIAGQKKQLAEQETPLRRLRGTMAGQGLEERCARAKERLLDMEVPVQLDAAEALAENTGASLSELKAGASRIVSLDIRKPKGSDEHHQLFLRQVSATRRLNERIRAIEEGQRSAEARRQAKKMIESAVSDIQGVQFRLQKDQIKGSETGAPVAALAAARKKLESVKDAEGAAQWLETCDALTEKLQRMKKGYEEETAANAAAKERIEREKKEAEERAKQEQAEAAERQKQAELAALREKIEKTKKKPLHTFLIAAGIVMAIYIALFASGTAKPADGSSAGPVYYVISVIPSALIGCIGWAISKAKNKILLESLTKQLEQKKKQ